MGMKSWPLRRPPVHPIELYDKIVRAMMPMPITVGI